jgi:hypothetical protein
MKVHIQRKHPGIGEPVEDYFEHNMFFLSLDKQKDKILIEEIGFTEIGIFWLKKVNAFKIY